MNAAGNDNASTRRNEPFMTLSCLANHLMRHDSIPVGQGETLLATRKFSMSFTKGCHVLQRPVKAAAIVLAMHIFRICDT
jgi:hypothetical protein